MEHGDALRLNLSTRTEILASLDLTDPDLRAPLDRLTDLVREVLNVPIALVSVVGADGQGLPGCSGVPPEIDEHRHTPLSHSFCKHVVAEKKPLVVPDAREDRRVADNPAVDELNVIAYIGMPLLSREGEVLGALAAIDGRPRPWSRRDERILRGLAETAVARLELQRHLSERQRVEEDREAISRRFRNLVRESKDWIWEVDLDGHFTFVNRRATELTGYAFDELVGRSLFDIMDEDEADRFQEALEPYLANERAFQDLEQQIRGKDGEPVDLSTSGVPIWDGRGELEGFQGIARDITFRIRRRQALEQDVVDRTQDLARANALYRSLFEHNPHAIYALNHQGEFVAANPATEAILDLPPDDLLGSRFSDLISENNRGLVLPLFEQVLKGEPQRYEMPVVTRSGDTILVRGVAAPITVGGDVRGVIGVAEDITARKEMEGQLRQAQKVEAVGQLAGGIAHDFNNLITGIRGFTQLLLEERTDLDPSIRDDLQEIDRTAARAAALTQQLLTFSRQTVVAPTVQDLNQVVEETLPMLRRTIPGSVLLISELEEDLWPVYADRAQLEQIIVNLVVNARDAMPQGGRVAIRSRNAEGEGGGADMVVFSVTDSGTGMSPETEERIFDPFFTTKDSQRGTGLGLSTVYGIVKRAGGSIHLETAVGQGTTFEVRLPRTDREPVEPPPFVPKDAEVTARQEGVVLLAEDETSVRSVVKRVLERGGYTVVDAPSGEVALERAEEWEGKLDLLLTDMNMEAMGGLELAKRLLAERSGLRVLYMSGFTADESVTRATLGPDAGFIGKPFTPLELLEAVREALMASPSDTAKGEAGDLGIAAE